MDPAEERRALFCFLLNATQIYRRIWRGVTYKKCDDITEDGQILVRERVFVARQRLGSRACQSAQDIYICLEKIWRAAKPCQYPNWEDCQCGAKTCYRGVVDEMILLFGKIATVGSR